MGLGHSPRIVTDGMVLYLDAANPKNYNLTAVEVLVVAGGGGGAADVGGAGGAGGLIYNSNFAITPGSALTVTVGAGGTGRAPFDNSAGGSGGNSIFGSLTATGGGGGGNYPSGSGTTGGSGGGGSNNGSGGAGTSGQGFAGGSGTGGDYQSGGGGGAGGVGGNGNSSSLIGGSGGVGLEFPQFASVGGSPAGWFAGGGGGGGGNDSGSDGRGFGGLGGGGTGASRSGTYATNSSFRNAVANTGGGGGGTGGWNTAGNGGSGIVIVRYPGPQKAIGGTITSNNGYTIHTFTTVGSTTFTPLVATNNSAILGLADFSGRGNFGTSVNGPTYSSSSGGSLSFDGVDDYTENSSPNLGITGDISASLSCWFYDENTSTSTAQALFVYGNGPTSGDSIAIILQNLSFSAAYNGGNNAYIANNVYTLNKWNNVVITKTPGAVNTTTKLYLNGVEQTITSSSTITPNVSSRIVRVGRWSNDGFPIYFKGRVSNCSIYNRALTVAEVQQNFNALRGRFGI